MRNGWAVTILGLVCLAVAQSGSAQMFPDSAGGLSQLDLISGDLEGDFVTGDLTYTANEDGPATFRIALKDGEGYDIAADRIEWVSAAQTLTLTGKASVEGDGLSINSTKIVYDIGRQRIDFPSRFELAEQGGGQVREIKGASGWVLLKEGAISTYGGKQVSGAMRPQDAGSSSLPVNRRVAQ